MIGRPMLTDDLTIQLADGLRRKSSTTCSKWSSNYVILGKPVPGPLRFDKHPWEKAMMDHDGNWAGMKAAQMGFTNVCLCRSMFTIDIKRSDVLYILPKKSPDAADFSKSKFDALLNVSPYLEKLFSNTRNVGHKQSGEVNLFIRGARSRSGLKSLSVALQIYDEFDEMPVKNMLLAEERSSGYAEEDTQKIYISTPTIPDYGIDAQIQLSTRDHYIFRCPRCSRHTELLYPECLIITADSLLADTRLRNSHLICKECHKPLPHESKPDWLSLRNATWEHTENADSPLRGFEINQLYSMKVSPYTIAKLVIKSQTSPEAAQELNNSKLGRTYVAEGARISEADITACIFTHTRDDPIPRNQILTMGVDVGHKEIFYHIDQWLLPAVLGPDLNAVAIPKVIAFGVVSDFPDLDKLMYQYQILHCVIDIEPAFREAFNFSNRFYGHVHLCRFVDSINSKNISLRPADNAIFINRTSWLDLSQTRFRNQRIRLPQDTTQIFRDHIRALIRVPKKDRFGNPTAFYVSRGPDHHALARVYSEAALPLAISSRENQNVSLYL